ncbi:single-stranded-DNA-specific exonuclease RecJ [Patescibacteria group bacterium]|nr:single-stranded-DNA-specific exonuclease RecJ [Patescibacteria group bacterium]
MSYTWKLPEKNNIDFSKNFPELDQTVAQLLFNRGLTSQAQVDEFLQPDYSQDIHDPYLFKDMEKACNRVYQAVDKNELITIYGDYDADGVCSSVILKTALEIIGAKVEVYLPHREKEGYGLNARAIEELAENNTKLIITCDCGISNALEVDIANKKAMDVIVTDHHAIPENLPKAKAIIHPQVEGEKYPFKFLAGGGVAFKFSQALIINLKNKQSDNEKELHEKWLLDLVAVSTVADMVPLLGENRTLLKYGLKVLKKNRRLGMKKLIEVANLDVEKLDARTIAFSIAPRINAAGRMDHANLAYYLMIEKDQDNATQLARDLNSSNIERQKLTEQIIKSARTKEINEDDYLYTFFDKDWSVGLTGLVAGRLVREFAKPAIVMTEVDGKIIGSGRSVKGFNISKALKELESFLERYGGHPQAAGFAMDKKNLDEFCKGLKKIAARDLAGQDLKPELEIELVIDFEDINWSIVDMLDKFDPYGQANPEPVFMSKEVKVTGVRKVGNDNRHLKLELAKGNKTKGAIAFGLGDREIEIGDMVDIVYNLNINQWNGNREIQLNILDIHPVK